MHNVLAPQTDMNAWTSVMLGNVLKLKKLLKSTTNTLDKIYLTTLLNYDGQ